MSRITLVTRILAPRERVFDLARSVDAHLASTHGTDERVVAGKTTGLLGLDDRITWRARHFGVVQELTSCITRFERPVYFRDSMVRGAFARFDHDHHFDEDGGATIMRDVFDFDAPLGVLGRVAERVFLERYMRSFLDVRARALKTIAEGEEWARFVGGDATR